MNEIEQQIMNAQMRQQLDNMHLTNNPSVIPEKWSKGVLGAYKELARKRTVIQIDEADNGKVITIGGDVCRLVPDGASLADELVIALTQAKLL